MSNEDAIPGSTTVEESARPSREVVFEATAISKSYPGVQALADVSLTLGRGKVLGIVGENGAGKSTLISVLNGSVRPDSGVVTVAGSELRLGSPAESAHRGIATVYQEQGLIPTLPVYENMFLGRESRFSTGGFLNRGALVASAQKTLDGLGIRVRAKSSTGDLSFSERQQVEIAKAFALTEAYRVEPIILLDEPTSALWAAEVDLLLSNIKLWQDRASFVFVSHRLADVFRVADRIAALKDGRLIAELDADTIDESGLHELIVGRKRDAEYYKESQQADPGDAVVLAVAGLSRRGAFDQVSFELRRGEILGIAGVAGCGKSELARAILGIEGYDEGSVQFAGKALPPRSLAEAIHRGAGYVPAERSREGIIGEHSIAANLTLTVLDQLRDWSRVGLSGKAAKRIVHEWTSRLRIKASDPNVPASTLSGGNQQKVVFAKWLAKKPVLLVLDDPGRGIDVGAKEDVYTLLRELSLDGVAIVLVSDNLPELIGLSHRIIVMRGARVTFEIAAPADAKPAETDVVRHMV